MNNAFREGTVMAAQATPGYLGVYWRLSGSHALQDVCDDYARHNGNGFWPKGEEPTTPHPWCLCYLVPAVEDSARFKERLRGWLRDPGSQPDLEQWYNGTARPFLERPAPRWERLNSESGASEQQTRGAIDPRLLASDAEDLRIWVDAGSRLSALESIVRAMPEDLSRLDPDDAALRQAVEYVDRQVAAGMSALGWTGRSVGRVLMRNVAERVQANKYPDCTLEISAEWLRRWVRKYRSPDTVIHTWVHESVHARRPFTVRQAGVELKVPGYEEGLAEGIAGLTVRSQAHMEPIVGGYALYVRSYESLASVLGVSAEDIWRSLWQYRVGEVRANFVDVVERYWYNLTGKRLSEREKRNLLWKADSLFKSTNQFESANAGWSDDSLARWWRSALPEMPESR